MFADRAPFTSGVNRTTIVQLALGASVAGAIGHADVCEKSLAFVPPSAMLAMASGAAPVFVSVRFCGALVVSTCCDPKDSDAGEMETAGAVPVPLSATACGLPLASSLIWTAAARAPVAAGVNVAVIVHVAFTASDAGQSLFCAKSAAFVPAMTIPPIVSEAVPVFFSVEDCDAVVVPTRTEPNASVDGVRVTAGAGVEPVPLRVTACGLPDASSVIVTLADRAPVAVGENVALMVHVALAASVPGQSFVCAKSPLTVIAAMVSGAVPLLVSVTGSAPLVVPTC